MFTNILDIFANLFSELLLIRDVSDLKVTVLANTEKNIHIMSCHIRHPCHFSYFQKTPKVVPGLVPGAGARISRCCTGPNTYGKRLLSIEIAATAEVSPVDGKEAVRLYK
jgi:hypothetical protein